MAAGVTRLVAPFVPESRLALANILAAFPEKTAREHRAILRGAWGNLARTVAELPSLRRIVFRDPADPAGGLSDRIEIVGEEWFRRAGERGGPGIAFLAHFGNWEVLPLVAQSFGIPLVALYRPMRNDGLQAMLDAWRGDACELVVSAPGAGIKVAAAMKRGAHLAMLADQRTPEGPAVPFFGRLAASNPIVGRLARQFDCPVHGVRAVRLSAGRFRVEATPPLDLPRDAGGRIDAEATTAMVAAVIEGWVREYPEQWLWLHNRWG